MEVPSTWRDRIAGEGRRLEEKRFERYFSAGAGASLSPSLLGRVGGSGGAFFVYGAASW